MTSPNIIPLNETQRELFLNASQRDDGAMSRPAGMKAATARKIAADLIEKKFAREVQAKTGAPVWRRDAETGRDIALVMTKRARASLEAQADQPAAVSISSDAAAHHHPRPRKMATTSSTDLSLSSQPGVESQPNASSAPQENAPNAGVCNDGIAIASEGPTPPLSMPRSGTKLASLIELLAREGGAGIEDLMAATGWLPHTVRAALTSLRRRGYDVTRQRAAQGSVYRVASAPALTAAA